MLYSKPMNGYVDKESFVKAICENHDQIWLSNLGLELAACSGIAWYAIASGKRFPSAILKLGTFLCTLTSSLKQENMILTRTPDSLNLIDANPTKRFASATKDFYAMILLSATINPSNVFLKSLGINKSQTILHKVEIPLQIRVKTLLDFGVTTRFKSRNPMMLSKISTKIVAISRAVRGSIGVFVTSYSVMEPLLQEVVAALPQKNIVAETRNLSNSEASECIDRFKSARGSILFAVQGGRFSEGEDFKEDFMDASIVVGLSLPPPSPTLYAEYAYLNRTGEPDSYLIISLLPALNKAFQSAGRHLRSPGKVGLVYLLDSRYNSETILNLMPPWLRNDMVKGDFSPEEIEQLGYEIHALNYQIP